MRLRFTTTFLLGMLLSPILSAPAAESKAPPALPLAPRVLTLPDVYELAVNRSETLGISREEIKIAEAQYWQAISNLLPKVDFVAGETLQNERGNSNNNNSSNSSSNRRDSFQGRLRVTQTIFNGFRDFNIAASVQAQKRSQESYYRRNRELLYLDSSDLFYQVLSLEEDLAVLHEIDVNFNDRQKELNDRIGIGRSRHSELLAADTEQADNAATIEEVRGLLGASRELLAFLIAIPSDRWTLKDTMPFPKADALNAYLWKSGARADVTAAMETSTAAQRQVSADKGSFWPAVSAEANFGVIEDYDRNEDWDIVLTAEIPIFDGGFRIGQLKESEARLRSSNLSFSRARRLAESEVRQKYNNFISSARQYVKLEEASETARKNYEAQKEDYRLGRASNLDSLTSLLRYNGIRRRLAGLEFQTRSNLVALQVAAGEPAATQPSTTTRTGQAGNQPARTVTP